MFNKSDKKTYYDKNKTNSQKFKNYTNRINEKHIQKNK